LTILPTSAGTTVGTYQYFVNLTDGRDWSNYTLTFNVVAAPINNPPTFGTVTLVNQTVYVGSSSLSYTLPSASDLENDAISITATLQGGANLPSFIVFSNSTNPPTFTITPTAALDIGEYNVTVSLSDASNFMKSNYSFFVIVPNRPPAFSSSLQTSAINVGKINPYSFNLPAYADPDGQSVTVTLIDQATGS